MLLHLPIVILATLSPVAVSDTVPKFDIVKDAGSRATRRLISTAVGRTKLPH
jgi:hypothetical protein